MSLFKIHREKTKQINQKLIGVYVPQSVDEHLTLHCLVTDTNKSVILRDLIADWGETGLTPIKTCTKALKKQLNINWSKLKEKQPMSYVTYIARARKELENKGISELIINQIIDEKN